MESLKKNHSRIETKQLRITLNRLTINYHKLFVYNSLKWFTAHFEVLLKPQPVTFCCVVFASRRNFFCVELWHHTAAWSFSQPDAGKQRLISQSLSSSSPRCLNFAAGQVAAVVMEITAGPASARGVVSMEIPRRGALAAVEEDEERGHTSTEERLQPTSRQGNFYMLIVIGEIATEHQLHTARQHIERGEPPSMPHQTRSINKAYDFSR